MYGLIQTLIRRPLSFSRFSIAGGSGNCSASHSKSHHWNSFIQKQSKWNTCSGTRRSLIPSMKVFTVFSS